MEQKEIEEKSNFLNEIIEETIEASENEISDELTVECNKKIEKCFVNNPIFINSIDKHIVLEGQTEGIFKKQELV